MKEHFCDHMNTRARARSWVFVCGGREAPYEGGTPLGIVFLTRREHPFRGVGGRVFSHLVRTSRWSSRQRLGSPYPAAANKLENWSCYRRHTRAVELVESCANRHWRHTRAMKLVEFCSNRHWRHTRTMKLVEFCANRHWRHTRAMKLVELCANCQLKIQYIQYLSNRINYH